MRWCSGADMPEAARSRLRGALAGTCLLERFDLSAAPFLERRGHDAALRALDGSLLQGLARVLARQPAAARFLALRPMLLERLAHGSVAAFEQRARELDAFVGDDDDDRESLLDRIRLLRHEETLFAACHDLGRMLRFARISSFLSSLAQACVRWALRTAERHSRAPGPSGLAIVGMGRIAGSELTYHSDLDLVFLHPEDSFGHIRPVQIAQRLIGYLSTMTSAGVAYTVDARLRPSGRQGALVTTFASFESYQLERAAAWEHLALMRTRAIAGNEAMCQHLLRLIRRRLLARTKPVWREIDCMRRRIERGRAARGGNALKTGRGGMMDVEFLAAGALLECGPSDALPSIARLLRSHVRGPQVTALLKDYAFLRQIEARARWVAGRAIEGLDLERADAPLVAELVRPGLSEQRLTVELETAQQRIHAAYVRVVEADTIRVLNGDGGRPESGSGGTHVGHGARDRS